MKLHAPFAKDTQRRDSNLQDRTRGQFFTRGAFAARLRGLGLSRSVIPSTNASQACILICDIANSSTKNVSISASRSVKVMSHACLLAASDRRCEKAAIRLIG